jgi:hypothetical protein
MHGGQRFPDTVCKDGLAPEGTDPDVFLGSKRLRAVFDVLCRLSDDDYDRVKALAGTFSWFLPDTFSLGMVYPFTAMYQSPGSTSPVARVIYLATGLEADDCEPETPVAVVAHELAHVALGHRLCAASAAEYHAQEEESWAQVCRWGFEREAQVHRARRAEDKRRARSG